MARGAMAGGRGLGPPWGSWLVSRLLLPRAVLILCICAETDMHTPRCPHVLSQDTCRDIPVSTCLPRPVSTQRRGNTQNRPAGGALAGPVSTGFRKKATLARAREQRGQGVVSLARVFGTPCPTPGTVGHPGLPKGLVAPLEG